MRKASKQISLTDDVHVTHHGGKNSVTGSCHELTIHGDGLLIDCGLFQGNDAVNKSLEIEFKISHICALVLTHAHIDHIGRLPWLLAKGFQGPIYCTYATAHLVPLMLDDGLRLQLDLTRVQRSRILERIKRQLQPAEYGSWVPIKSQQQSYFTYIRFSPAGHILGSAYVEVKLPTQEIAVFSGDLGPKNTPLLPDPLPPKRADYLFIETTYGNKQHESVEARSERLLTIIMKSLQNGGTIIIPAFSVGRTQELLYDIESLLYQKQLSDSLPIIVDSPMAAKITKAYRQYRKLWTAEAKGKRDAGRYPLGFRQCVVIDSHKEHIALVNRLASTGEPAIVIAASGMCMGGRVMDYLKALLPDSRSDVIFTGYQVKGTLGRQLQKKVKRVEIDNQSVAVQACIHTMSGYSAHADQQDLMSYITGCKDQLKQLHLIHGEKDAKEALVECISPYLEPPTRIVY
ncbi:MBL fold metallo-hydrolase [Vibrio sp. SCSIO 43140]|uniref:MBL fold metallo-hydrolase RNA specificity domain-containing protein n=1 Tax=Vibrio sp. SCSIO 43140 TaxID=2819100 RepID=UPI00207541EF|nr:MBL fold metallo-hydrolase [Vibrio sp. SCSIO 43140]USD60263.1 MBL fold metallo-hydrolase [Vibrio sp. SCSIO 43140]